MWKILVPARIHIFVWLVMNNKLLTRENLSKRRTLEDQTCLFCSEIEIVNHIFFGCCVARSVWETLAEILNVHMGHDFESVEKLWLQYKKYKLVNIFTGLCENHGMIFVFREFTGPE
jgi:hypothetical protein